MTDVISGTALIATGFSMVLFRKRFARSSVDFQNKSFGFRFKEKEVKGSSLAFIIIGVAVIMAGVLTLMGKSW